MYKRLNFTISGIAPLLLHNSQLADPLNPWAKKLKAVSGKRTKTDEDHEAMAKIEWFGSMYVDDDMRPCIPGTNIEALFAEAGKKQKLGKQFKAGLISDGNWPIDYDGPKTVEELWSKAAMKFTDRRIAKLNGKTSIVRTRPIFRKWKLSFAVDYLPSLLNPAQLSESLATAGQIIGLADYKPKFGRFEVV